ncbi:MAG TPA: hypothetical protein GX511_03865, partial [Firmicutes bacterium]|nr:hypothetical protein [Bacillota bacterium]
MIKEEALDWLCLVERLPLREELKETLRTATPLALEVSPDGRDWHLLLRCPCSLPATLREEVGRAIAGLTASRPVVK